MCCQSRNSGKGGGGVMLSHQVKGWCEWGTVCTCCILVGILGVLRLNPPFFPRATTASVWSLRLSHRLPFWKLLANVDSGPKVERELRTFSNRLRRHQLGEGIISLSEHSTNLLSDMVCASSCSLVWATMISCLQNSSVIPFGGLIELSKDEALLSLYQIGNTKSKNQFLCDILCQVTCFCKTPFINVF